MNAPSSTSLNNPTGIRSSNGLAEFCTALVERTGLAVLDFAPASQSTVSFITNYGHRLYSEDFLEQLDQAFTANSLEAPLSETVSRDPLVNQSNPLLVSRFFSSALNFTDQSFDGVLVWDSLEYIAPPLLEAVVGKLHRILRPGGRILTTFHVESSVELPGHTYRIHDSQTLELVQGRPRRPAQMFSNRALEKLFQDFSTVKFFLTRHQQREVIVRR